MPFSLIQYRYHQFSFELTCQTLGIDTLQCHGGFFTVWTALCLVVCTRCDSRGWSRVPSLSSTWGELGPLVALMRCAARLSVALMGLCSIFHLPPVSVPGLDMMTSCNATELSYDLHRSIASVFTGIPSSAQLAFETYPNVSKQALLSSEIDALRRVGGHIEKTRKSSSIRYGTTSWLQTFDVSSIVSPVTEDVACSGHGITSDTYHRNL